MWFFAIAVAHAQPTCPATVAEFAAAIDDAENAFASLDLAGLRTSVADATGEIGCLPGAIPPILAARLHRVEALRAFADADEGAARRALLAARVLDPTGELPPRVVPADHPIRKLDPGPQSQAPASVVVPAPTAGHVVFDGSVRLDRPSDRPTVLQLVDNRGAVTLGAYLWPEASMPPYSIAVATASSGGTSTATVRPRSGHVSVPLAIVGGVGLAAAGVTYALAGSSHAEFIDPATPNSEIPVLYETTNTLVYASIACAAVGVGTGATAVIVGQW
ncbi:hypothetical protein LBMAG42_05330 [Deltaproteobacteria bacterium]|nr:hypothetical protein LBMAG42_05330 [Deltaproteobacteria bacterium]